MLLSRKKILGLFRDASQFILLSLAVEFYRSLWSNYPRLVSNYLITV